MKKTKNQEKRENGVSRASSSSRRSFLKSTGLLTTGFALSGLAIPKVHAKEDNTIRVGGIGCGGRGRGAIANAISTPGPTRLVAICDAHIDRAKGTVAGFQKDENLAPKCQGLEDNIFGGLDGYKKVMDVLSPGDVVVLGTPPAFRPLHYAYAVKRGLHVFAEKALAVDTPGCKKMLAANAIAKQKNLKAMVGLDQRHFWRAEETIKKIHDGAIGDIVSCWVYRLQNDYGFHNNPNLSPLQNQLLHYGGYTWLSGSYMVDWMIHNIDICCWTRKEMQPVSVQGQGGRQVRRHPDQMYDHCAYEYCFEDGVKMMVQLRQLSKGWQAFKAVIHGTKGSAVLGEGVGEPAIYKRHRETRQDMVWQSELPGNSTKQEEMNRLFKAVRDDSPFNDIDRGVHASFVSIMGRMAVDSGQELTHETCWNSTYDLCPDIENWTMDSPAPVMPQADGTYPLAIPGETKQY